MRNIISISNFSREEFFACSARNQISPKSKMLIKMFAISVLHGLTKIAKFAEYIEHFRIIAYYVLYCKKVHLIINVFEMLEPYHMQN